MSSSHVMEEIMEELRSAAMKGKWSLVLKIYRENRELHAAKITATGHTVLHMAVSCGPEKAAARMVDIVRTSQQDEEAGGDDGSEMHKVLGVENISKNTPLHFAASMGNVEMCKKIGLEVPSLVGKRNSDGETPLFLAARHGQKKAFLWLHYIAGVSSLDDFAKYCTRDDGATILHCAIEGEHFEVAIEIVLLYKNLVKEMMSPNHDGLSPLHLLAATPSAFKSGTFLGRPFGQIAYFFLRVEEKKEAVKLNELEGERQSCVRLLTGAMDDRILQEKNENTSIGWLFEKLTIILKHVTWVLHQLLELFELVGGNIYGLYGVREKKEKHVWCGQIMNTLLHNASDSFMSTMVPIPRKPTTSCAQKQEDQESDGPKRIETPLMIAAKNGVREMVETIVKKFPSTIYDVNDEGKNIVLLAAENKQSSVYDYLCTHRILDESLFRKVDKDGNSALHLAARFGDSRNEEFSGEALPMQWEYKWFKYVKDSVAGGVFARYNNKYETPEDIFKQSHEDLQKSDLDSLSKTSQACSVVSVLVATVAFAIIGNVPGGFADDGATHLLHRLVFQILTATSLAALCFSLISTIVFLSIATSHYQAADYLINLPSMLFVGMSALFLSILFMWITFCAGHTILLVRLARKVYVGIYLVISIPVTIYAISKFPVYWNLLFASFKRTPAPCHNTIPLIKYPKTKKKEKCTDRSKHHHK